MSKHIKPFLSRINSLLESDDIDPNGEIYPEGDDKKDVKRDPTEPFREEILSKSAKREKFLSDINQKLSDNFERYHTFFSESVKMISEKREALKKENEEFVKMIKEVHFELEENGERFENNQYELASLIIRISESEKTTERTEKEKLELFSIIEECYNDTLKLAIEYGINTNRIAPDREFTLMSVTPKPKVIVDEEGNERVSQRFPSKAFTHREYTNESLNESLISFIRDKFKDIARNVKRKFFGIEDSLENLEYNIRRLKKFV